MCFHSIRNTPVRNLLTLQRLPTGKIPFKPHSGGTQSRYHEDQERYCDKSEVTQKDRCGEAGTGALLLTPGSHQRMQTRTVYLKKAVQKLEAGPPASGHPVPTEEVPITP